jgi:hypothetical protein
MRRLSMWRRVAGATIAVLAAGTLAASAPVNPAAGTFAYLTTLAIVVHEGDQRVARGDGYFEDAVLRWTHDGRFAFAVSRLAGVTAGDAETAAEDSTGEGTVVPDTTDSEPRNRTEDGMIVAIDTLTRSVRQIPCDCWDVLPVGDASEVVEVTGRRRLETLDLAGNGAWREAPAQLPVADGQDAEDPWASVHPAGSDGSTAYLAAVPSGGNAGQNMPAYLVATDGAADTRIITRIESGFAQMAAPFGTARPARLALTHQDQSACDAQDHVSILDLARRTITKTSFADPAIPKAQRRIAVLDSWWGRDGGLYATAAAWTCAEDQVAVQITAPSVWRFEGRGWKRADHAPVLSQRDLRSGTELVIGTDRRLFLHRGAEPRHVSDDVSQIATRGCEEAAPADRCRFKD